MQLDKPNDFANMPVFAELQDLMEKVFLKVPSISYEAKDWETFPKATSDIGGEVEKRITKVKVYNGHEDVGELRVVRENFRNQGTTTVYRVRSQHIQNRIGNKNTKMTTNAKIALSTAIKHFGRVSTSSETVEKVITEFRHGFNGVSYNANRNVERIGDHNEVALIEYFFATQKNEPFDMTRLKSVVNYKDADKVINTGRITRSIEADLVGNSGMIVKEERDGTLTAVNLDSTLPMDTRVTRHADSYGLPEFYQPKLAMLRMIDEKQPVESIGVKLVIDKTNWYYLTGGEIITYS